MAESAQHPQATHRPAGHIGTELFHITARDGTLLAAEEQVGTTARALATVIFVHGYAGNRHEDNGAGDGSGFFDYLAQDAVANDYRALRYDGRGLGDSKGNFASGTMDNHVADFLDVLQFARKRYGKSERMIVVGFSIGAAIAHEATQNKTRARTPEEDAAIRQIDRMSYIAPAPPFDSMWHRYKALYDELIERQRNGEENPTVLKPDSTVKLGYPAWKCCLPA